jgi:hypothetical protein
VLFLMRNIMTDNGLWKPVERPVTIGTGGADSSVPFAEGREALSRAFSSA